MMAVTPFCLQILFIIGFPINLEALVFSDNCNWNYTLKVLYVLCFTRPRYHVSVYRTIGPLVSNNLHFQNIHGISEYYVEYSNIGPDCNWLHKKVATYKMSRGYFVNSAVERTSDPAIQRINISWPLERDILEYLLTIKLLRPDNGFYVRPEDTVCIYVRVKQAKEQIQFQQNHMLIFDCIQIRTGTVGATMEMILRKRAARGTGCNIMERPKDRPCFREMPELYHFDIDAHCCPENMPELRVVESKSYFCTWIVSFRSQGLSSATYFLKASDGTLVDEGNIIADKTKGLFVRCIPIESPDTFTIAISSWCSFDPDSAQEDHICFSVEEKINATMCNRPTAKTGLQKEGPTIDGFCFTTKEIIAPECVTIITLGCVAVVILSTVCVFLYCRGYYPCYRAMTEGPRNNDVINNDVISNVALGQADETIINELDPFLIDNTISNRRVSHDPVQNGDVFTETKVVYAHR